MVIDKQKVECIDYLIAGYTITDTAKLLNICRQSIYNWLADKDFKAELDKRIQELSVAGNNKILADVITYVDRLKLLATKSKSEKVQLDALTYLLDRVYGKPTSNLNVNDNEDDKDNVDKDILDEILDSTADNEEQEKNNMEE